jgi:hypothetical protein
MKLRWPLAAIVLALLCLGLTGGHSTVGTVIALSVLVAGIVVTIWALKEKRPL